MFRIGLFDHPVAAQPAAFAANVSTPAHVALARTVSEAGTVLLKNQGGILPLTGSGKTIAVIGQPAGAAGAENEYNGEGSGHVPEFGDIPAVSPQQGITTRAAGSGDAVVYADGTATADAVAAAKVAERRDRLRRRHRERGDRPLQPHAHRAACARSRAARPSRMTRTR